MRTIYSLEFWKDLLERVFIGSVTALGGVIAVDGIAQIDGFDWGHQIGAAALGGALTAFVAAVAGLRGGDASLRTSKRS